MSNVFRRLINLLKCTNHT